MNRLPLLCVLSSFWLNTAVKEYIILVYVFSAILFLVGMFLHGINEINKEAE